MSEKRFELYSDDYFVGAYDNVTQEKINVLKSIDLLNSLVEENEQLRTQLAICQQSNDDGRFKVWEVPPIPKGTRITFSTTERSGKNE